METQEQTQMGKQERVTGRAALLLLVVLAVCLLTTMLRRPVPASRIAHSPPSASQQSQNQLFRNQQRRKRIPGMADSTLTKDGVKRTGIAPNITPGTPYPGAQTSPPVGYFSLWEGNTQVIPDTQWNNGAGPAGTGQAVVDGFTVNGAGSSPVRLNFQNTGATTIPDFTNAVLIINSASNGAPSWGYVDIVDAAIQVPKNAAVENLTFSQTQFYGNPGGGGATLYQGYSFLQNMTAPGSGGPFSYQGLTVTCNPSTPSGGAVATSATGTVTAVSGAAIPAGNSYFVVVGIGNGVAVVSQLFDVVAAPALSPPRNLSVATIY